MNLAVTGVAEFDALMDELVTYCTASAGMAMAMRLEPDEGALVCMDSRSSFEPAVVTAIVDRGACGVSPLRL